MIYIIYGNEECFIVDKINEFVNQKDTEVIRFDGSDKLFSLQEMVDSCLGNSLFANRTAVLVKDPYFLIRKANDDDLKSVLEYVAHPIYENDLVFYTLSNSFSSKLSAYKKIAENAEIIRLDGYNYKDFNTYCNSRVNEMKLNISQDSLKYLISICKRNATTFNNNLEILSLYGGKINNEVINKLCSGEDNDIFDLINALTSKNISLAISLERKMLKDSNDMLGIINLLAGQLRYLYYVSLLRSEGKKRNEIMELTGSSDYKYEKTIETLGKINSRQILELQKNLHDLDCKIKNDNSLSEQTNFEFLVLSLLRKERYAGN